LLRDRNDSTSTSFSTFCHDWLIFGSHDFELTTAKLFERAATTQTRGLEPPREASDQAESARVLTGEALRVKEELQDTPKRNLFNRDHVKEVQQRLIQ